MTGVASVGHINYDGCLAIIIMSIRRRRVLQTLKSNYVTHIISLVLFCNQIQMLCSYTFFL